MRNRWGVDVKKGHWVRFSLPRGGQAEDNVSRVEREPGRGYVVTLESGRTVALDDVSVSMGPMTVGRGGVVRQNPDAVHIDIGSHNAGGEGAKTNPALRQTYGSFDAYGKRRFFGPSQNEWAIARGFPFEMENSRIDGGNTPIQFSKTRAYVCVDEDESGEPVVEVWPIRNLTHPGVPNMGVKGWKRGDTGALGRALNNPTPRLDHWEQASQRAHTGPRGGLTKKPSPRLIQRRLKTHHQKMPGVWANPLVNVKVKSPAQRGKGAPDGRLIARRKVTEKAPEGFYANPLHSKRESNANAARYAELYGGAPDTIRAWKDHYIVRFHKPGEKLWTPIAVFKTLNVATTFAKEHARLHPTYTVSIVDKAE